jgi:hypothetical protein
MTIVNYPAEPTLPRSPRVRVLLLRMTLAAARSRLSRRLGPPPAPPRRRFAAMWAASRQRPYGTR